MDIESLTMLLVPAVSPRATVRVQSPLAVSADSEPEPDLAVVEPGDRRHGHPETALLVIEVSETSLGKDREIKPTLYAAAGVPEYWAVNLPDSVVEVHTDIGQGEYRTIRRYRRGDTIELEVLAGVTVAVSLFLPTSGSEG